MKKTLTLALMFNAAMLFAQHNINNVQLPDMLAQSGRKELRVPDVLGYTTLKCDFHIHTVFSDGSVWPTVRVEEAWAEGLDYIALTDHIEGHPSKKYVSGDKNASYEIALPKAQEMQIGLVQAGEITRSMPPGHLNALFVDDVNALVQQDPWDAIAAAKKKDAFIMWNHPGWKAQQPDSCRWTEYHERLFKAGMINGIEVFNEQEWYPIALDWCLEKNLAPIANTDIHGVAGYLYDFSKFPRPMTLVLAKDRSMQSLKEAMMSARTVACFAGILAGRQEYVEAIFKASIQMQATGVKDNKGRERFLITNKTDIAYELRGDMELRLPANTTVAVMRESGIAKVEVANCYVGSSKLMQTSISF